MAEDLIYAIGVVASPRQMSLNYQGTRGKGTSVFQRGLYQFTGHTALYAREGSRVLMAKGLVPKINEIFFAVLGKKEVPGKWQEDQTLFQDPTSVAFEIKVDKDTAKKFQVYFHHYIEKELKKYKLHPEKYNETNCVHSTAVGFVNFMLDYSQSIRKKALEESEKIDLILHQFIEAIANKSQTKQGHFMTVINTMNQTVRIDKNALFTDLESYLIRQTQRLKRIHPVCNKYRVGMALLEQLHTLKTPNDFSLDALQSMAEKIEAFACIRRGIFNPLSTKTKSKQEWNVIAMAYHLKSDEKNQLLIKGKNLLADLGVDNSTPYKKALKKYKAIEEEGPSKNEKKT